VTLILGLHINISTCCLFCKPATSFAVVFAARKQNFGIHIIIIIKCANQQQTQSMEGTANKICSPAAAKKATETCRHK